MFPKGVPSALGAPFGDKTLYVHKHVLSPKGAPSAFVSLQTRVYPTFVPFVCVTLSLLLFVCLLSCIDSIRFFIRIGFYLIFDYK